MKRLIRSSLTWMFALFLLTPPFSYSQCNLVATVYETNICKSDIAIPNIAQYGKKISNEQRLKLEKGNLVRKIQEIFTKYNLTKKSYTPTTSEIESFIEFQKAAEASRLRQSQELVSTIEQLLKKYRYSDKNQTRLENALKIHKKSVEMHRSMRDSMSKTVEDHRKRFGEEAAKKLQEHIEKTRQRSSEQWVGRWKMNKALYQKYGGRVIFQQAGIEPIDAYRNQLRDIREKGKLRILKSEYKDLFADFERYLEMGHLYLDEKEKNYFDRPYWETADLEGDHEKRLNEYRAIPHL